MVSSTACGELHGEIMVILIFTVTAAESGCGLSLLVAYFLNEFELQGYYQRLVKHLLGLFIGYSV